MLNACGGQSSICFWIGHHLLSLRLGRGSWRELKKTVTLTRAVVWPWWCPVQLWWCPVWPSEHRNTSQTSSSELLNVSCQQLCFFVCSSWEVGKPFELLLKFAQSFFFGQNCLTGLIKFCIILKEPQNLDFKWLLIWCKFSLTFCLFLQQKPAQWRKRWKGTYAIVINLLVSCFPSGFEFEYWLLTL